jgi:Fe-S oxidoreductase
LQKIGKLTSTEFEKENALCCGGSLSNTVIELDTQIKIRNHALEELTKSNPDVLATSCPLCKKSFVHGNKAKVMDIAEIVADSLKQKNNSVQEQVKKRTEVKVIA